MRRLTQMAAFAVANGAEAVVDEYRGCVVVFILNKYGDYYMAHDVYNANDLLDVLGYQDFYATRDQFPAHT